MTIAVLFTAVTTQVSIAKEVEEAPEKEDAAGAIEICNCEDDDGDGLVDEDLDCEYKATIELTADDAYDAYLDGALVGSDTDWTDIETYSTAVPAGTHHYAVYAEDTQGVVAGFLAAVYVDGALIDLTDDAASNWMGTSVNPGTGWTTTTAGLNSTVSAPCTEWGTFWPQPLLSLGADWVWEEDCQDEASYPENWYVLEFEVCPEAIPPEICNCEDDDGDGLVDEGLRCEYPVAMRITADDEYDAYVDGALWGSDSDWTDIESYATSVPAGTHHLAVYAQDTQGVVAGFMAAVSVNGVVVDLTDDVNSNWMGTSVSPGGSWTTTTAGLNPTVSATCPDWGTFWPAGLLSMGADWVWEKDCSDPTTYPENWYVLELEVCPEAL
ncbi:MAG: hypothetical protein KTR31_41950 [Myxococcales bacterium]|nr:hypothetical protein [Myxococcales bacterium]